EDVEVLGGGAPHVCPPRTVVPPQYALRALRPGRRTRPGERLVLITDVTGRSAGRVWKSEEQPREHRKKPDQTAESNMSPPRTPPPFLAYALQFLSPQSMCGTSAISL